MAVTREEVIYLLDQLVRIESVTPWLIPTGSGERRVAEFMGTWLSDLGLEVTLDEVTDGRPNVVARLRGSGAGPTLCLNAHSDTVGYENWADRALTPRIEGDRMYGLGVVDDKGGCAAGMLAVRELVHSGVQLNGDVVLAFCIDEEGVSSGTEHLVAHHTFDAAIVIEPTGLPLAITEHQGFGWIDITVFGKASHGSTPDEGIDAIVHMAEVIRALHKLDETTWKPNPDPLNGRTVFHTGTIHGGTDYATYPSQVTLGIEIGTQPGETLANRVADIENIFAEITKEFPDFKAEIKVQVDRDPFQGAGFEKLLEAFDASALELLGTPMTRRGENAWTDAALMQSAGIPTILMGPLGGNLHSPDEWADLNEMVQTVELLTATIARYLS